MAGLPNLAYEDSDQVLGVPYARNADPGSHSYIDLKREVERIDELPELRERPELREVVQRLNDPKGFFRSIGCECWSGAADTGTEFASYVGFALDIWPFSSKQTAESIVLAFIESGRLVQWPPKLKMILVIRPTAFYDLAQQGWSLEFWARGAGADVAEARAEWSFALREFCTFIEAENQRWSLFLENHPRPNAT